MSNTPMDRRSFLVGTASLALGAVVQAGNPPQDTPEDRFDELEDNTVYHEDGFTIRLRQLIGRRMDKNTRRMRVEFYRRIGQDEKTNEWEEDKIPRYHEATDDFRATFFDQGRIRKVVGDIFRTTETYKQDPEIKDREFKPVNPIVYPDVPPNTMEGRADLTDLMTVEEQRKRLLLFQDSHEALP